MPRFLPLVLLAAVLAGCTVPPPPGVEEGAHEEVPLNRTGERPLHARGFEVDWRHPVTGESTRLVWDATEQQYRDGVYTVASENFTLRYRLDEFVPVRLRFDEDLSRQNSFNFTYREPRDLANRTVTVVLDVDPESFLDVTTDQTVNRDVAGSFRIAFTGACRAEDAACAAPGEPAIVKLDGRFPPPRH